MQAMFVARERDGEGGLGKYRNGFDFFGMTCTFPVKTFSIEYLLSLMVKNILRIIMSKKRFMTLRSIVPFNIIAGKMLMSRNYFCTVFSL